MLASYLKSRSAAFLLAVFVLLSFAAQALNPVVQLPITGTVVDPSGAVVTNATVEAS